MNRILSSKWTKAVVFLLGLAPFAYLMWIGYEAWRTTDFAEWLTANPIQYITHYTGDWTIRFLELTLLITPVRMLTNRPQFTRFRRMLGLFAFFYVCLHFFTWSVLDTHYNWASIWDDIIKRRYITVGMIGLTAMIPLAITSTAGWVRRLKFKRWQKLHRLVYLAALCGVIHYWWLVKSDIRLPAMYATFLAILMGFRVYQWTRKSKVVAKSPTVTASV